MIQHEIQHLVALEETRRYGCGRPVNPGRHASGRAYDTCCRDCASGSHDPMCGQAGAMDQARDCQEPEKDAVEPGFCKMRQVKSHMWQRQLVVQLVDRIWSDAG